MSSRSCFCKIYILSLTSPAIIKYCNSFYPVEGIDLQRCQPYLNLWDSFSYFTIFFLKKKYYLKLFVFLWPTNSTNLDRDLNSIFFSRLYLLNLLVLKIYLAIFCITYSYVPGFFFILLEEMFVFNLGHVSFAYISQFFSTKKKERLIW